MASHTGNTARRGWQRDELLLAFNLYCKIPFGRMHRNNIDIIELANQIGRTPSAVAMKLVNFASLDPVHQQRNVSGLKNASQGDRDIFAEFRSDWESLAYESEQARERLIETESRSSPSNPDAESPGGPTETIRLQRIRTVQGFFRSAVMASNENRCAMCSININLLLNASHIVPWSKDMQRRADPTNGIALCALHDRAFDRGLLAITDDFKIIASKKLETRGHSDFHRIALLEIDGKTIVLPHRFYPDREALDFHRQSIFVDAA
jgi:putative restriction endonuclease